MNRLLQGDVGAGKTVVALLAAIVAMENGLQVAFMAPTEILAEQHYRKLAVWLAGLPVEIAWLSGSLPAKERRRAQERLASSKGCCATRERRIGSTSSRRSTPSSKESSWTPRRT